MPSFLEQFEDWYATYQGPLSKEEVYSMWIEERLSIDGIRSPGAWGRKIGPNLLQRIRNLFRS